MRPRLEDDWKVVDWLKAEGSRVAPAARRIEICMVP